MDLVWHDTNDGPWISQTKLRILSAAMVLSAQHTGLTIFLVILLNDEGKLTISNDLVIILMPPADGSIFWTGEFGEGMEVQAVGDQSENICQTSHKKDNDSLAGEGRESHLGMIVYNVNYSGGLTMSIRA